MKLLALSSFALIVAFLGQPAFAAEARLSEGRAVRLAQNEEACPSGKPDCPDEARGKRRGERGQGKGRNRKDADERDEKPKARERGKPGGNEEGAGRRNPDKADEAGRDRRRKQEPRPAKQRDRGEESKPKSQQRDRREEGEPQSQPQNRGEGRKPQSQQQNRGEGRKPQSQPQNRGEGRKPQSQQQNRGAEGQPKSQQRERPRADQQRSNRRQDARPSDQPAEVRQEQRDSGPRKAAREERRRVRKNRRDERQRQQPAANRPAQAGESVVERQLEAQGDRREAERVRDLRRKLKREREKAQAERRARPDAKQDGRRDAKRGDDGDRRRGRREREVTERRGDRIIVRFGNTILVEQDEPDHRLLYGARDVEVEEFADGSTRTTVYRENGSRIVTTRNVYGEITSRVRYRPDGEIVVLIGGGQPYYGPPPIYYEEVPLAPLVIPIPYEEYVVEMGQASPLQIEAALTAPPVEPVERAYSLEEIRVSDRLRDKMRRVDLDTITFDFGSAVIGYEELGALDRIGEGIEEVLATDPDEVFLIEGHTDAVGSEEANLVLSDLRAEAVAVALSEDFDIPPENLVTQGYGEAYLKVPTEAPERTNRRVTVRRITPLLRGVAEAAPQQ